jgi:hypothetical protein
VVPVEGRDITPAMERMLSRLRKDEEEDQAEEEGDGED